MDEADAAFELKKRTGDALTTSAATQQSSEIMMDDEDEDQGVPTVTVAGEAVPITEVRGDAAVVGVGVGGYVVAAAPDHEQLGIRSTRVVYVVILLSLYVQYV